MAVTDRLTAPLNRVGAAAQNALEVARFGGLETGEEDSPYAVVAERPIYRLRRYFPDETADDRSALILVPPMMLAAEVWDVSPGSTAVGSLHAQGVDPWVVDFGAPEREEGGLERTLTDHVLAVSDAVDRVREATGRDVHLGGYSQGGMFCYQAAALRRGEGLASVVSFGSPVDTASAMPLGIPEEVASRIANVLADSTLARNAVPAWMSRPASGCSIRSRPRASNSTSCASCTTARRCSPASASAASFRARAGSHGPAPRSPTSCASSSPTTACSRAGS
jgi:putative long chain acyl-CoA synthase